MATIDFSSVSSASITLLVDNHADLLLDSTETVKRFNDKPLLAEHGFSALADLNEGETRLLWDAGVSQSTLLENARRMKIDLKAVNMIALSHGHDDHTAALSEVFRALDLQPQPREWALGVPDEELAAYAAARRLPVILHPAALRERWGVRKDGSKEGPYSLPPWQDWQALGAELVLSEGPHRLAPGCWTTGYVPRLSFEQSGRPSGRMLYRDADGFKPDDIEDDQAILIHVAGKGLVVLAGCAHSGIVNTVSYARQVSGEQQVLAVLGGFHLAHASESELERTLAAMKEFNPALLSPAHCTGFKATAALASQFPVAFTPASVGTTYLF